VFIIMSYWWAIHFFCYFNLKRGPNYAFFFIQFWCHFFIVEWIVSRNFDRSWGISTIFYGFRDKLDRTKSANFQNLKAIIFHPILMQVFYYFISKRGLKVSRIQKCHMFTRLQNWLFNMNYKFAISNTNLIALIMCSVL